MRLNKSVEMNNKHNQLIESLVSDLPQSQRRVLPPLLIGGVWFLIALLLSSLVMFFIQPFRPGVLVQIQTVPLFAVELVSGFCALALLSIAAFKSAVPGESKHYLLLGFACLLVWLSVVLSGFVEPILHPSMAGKRETCYFEAVLYSTSCALFSIFLLQRRYSLQPLVTAGVAAIWVGFVPAYLMQVSCMHEANHSLTHHLLPMGLTAIFWMPLFYWIIKRRSH